MRTLLDLSMARQRWVSKRPETLATCPLCVLFKLSSFPRKKSRAFGLKPAKQMVGGKL
jgi:hypothetical protein